MRSLTASETVDLLPPQRLVDAIETMFRQGCAAPMRAHHTIDVPGSVPATLLLMPAWQSGDAIGVKLVSVFPGNSKTGKPAVSGTYVLMDATDGRVRAVFDAAELTCRRTAAASALAARYLARADARTLLVLGAGKVSTELVRFHLALRPAIERVMLWARRPERAAVLRDLAQSMGKEAVVVTDLDQAVREADMVSSATMAQVPLIRGEFLQPGTHIDLVGGFTRTMREADDQAILRSTVFVDTIDGATKEAGDIVSPLESGALKLATIVDLAQLCQGAHPGRTSSTEITLFKSVGTALEDLAAAKLIASQGGF